MIDGGFHPTYRLLYLAGAPVVGVRASFGRFRHSLQGEDTACVQVRFANGVLGEVFTSWAMPQPYGSYQIHVIGERGQLFGQRDELYLLRPGETEPEKRSLPAADTFTKQIAHFAECLKDGKRPVAGVEEGRATLDVVLRAARDAEGWQAYAPKKMD
ncbi:MAG: Gfo/Idh/MocA family oxidoreductase [Candidatus Sumerlaeota bacterium]|nr:Gfo/Idh/MocA family oxidoreductase [Candidatus Sumerlaeota bacterium]